MKRILIYMMLLMGVILPSSAKDRAQQVIAHRGYWKTEGSAQNSISSLQNTHRIGVYGSEFDVHITRDGEVVVFHDDDVDGIKIENANYADIRDKRLKNGEKIPTLKEYLDAAKSLGDMKLILEVKEHIQKSDATATQPIVYNPSEKMHYQRTLVFPLQKAGDFKSRITGVKVSQK